MSSVVRYACTTQQSAFRAFELEFTHWTLMLSDESISRVYFGNVALKDGRRNANTFLLAWIARCWERDDKISCWARSLAYVASIGMYMALLLTHYSGDVLHAPNCFVHLAQRNAVCALFDVGPCSISPPIQISTILSMLPPLLCHMLKRGQQAPPSEI